MTLRDLFTKVPFDSLVPYIKESKEAGDVCHFKEAYDILLHTKANEKGCSKVYVELYEESSGETLPYASQLEGRDWSEYIDGEIVLDEGVKATDEALAYRLLWHLTFFGYTPEDKDEAYKRMRNDEYHDTEYGRKARYIEHKRYMLWANKTVRQHIIKAIREAESKGETNFRLPSKDWDYINHHEHHCNRMKRKRDYRLRLRQDELANLDLCENTTRRLLAGQSEVKQGDLAFLRETTNRLGNEFQTRAYDVNHRLAYLDELISKYEALSVAERLERIVVKVSTSSDCHLTEDERAYIYNKVNLHDSGHQAILIESTDDSLGCEIGVMIVGPAKQ